MNARLATIILGDFELYYLLVLIINFYSVQGNSILFKCVLVDFFYYLSAPFFLSCFLEGKK